MSKQIHAIIWDLVGVYFNDPRREIIGQVSEHTNIEYAVVSYVFTQSKLNTALKTGDLSFEDYLQQAAQMIGYNGDLALELDWHKVWFDRYRPRAGIEKLLEEVKDKGRRNVSISDNFKELVKHLEEEHHFEKHFDLCVWSYDPNVRVRKPSRKIYDETLKAAKCEGYQTIYLDDTAANCRVASQLGIKAIHVEAKRDDTQVVRAIRQALKDHGIRVRK